jgi:hypothetical protein
MKIELCIPEGEGAERIREGRAYTFDNLFDADGRLIGYAVIDAETGETVLTLPKSAVRRAETVQ